MPSPQTKTFTIRKSAAGVLDVRSDIQLTAPAGVAEMLDGEGRLPASLDAVRLADVALSVESGDRGVAFDSGRGKVKLGAEAGPFGGLGVYRSPRAMSRDLAEIATGNAKTPIPLDQIGLAEVAAARYCVLYAGYSAQAAASGSIALGAGGAVTFGAQGGRRRAFAVVQAHAEEPKIHGAVRDLIEAWRLPSQVSSPSDLPPGTWIMAEVAGSIQANAGVQFGLDFNWIRSVKAGELQGDIGLKIQAGANAAFGFKTSDRYAIVVGRDSLDPADEKIRVRLHRLNERGWSFAASAALALKGSTETLTPKQMDDFIAAVLGVHGMQTLQEVRRWTEPGRALSDVAADFLDGYARKRFGGALEKKLEEVRAEALGWFENWDKLPGRASSALWDIARLPQKEVQQFVARIEKLAAGDEKAVQAEVAAIVSRSDFAQTPVGLWLESVAAGRVMGVLANLPQAGVVRQAAARTLEIVRGGLFGELQTYVEQQVGLPPLREALQKNDFKTLNAKLKAKLAELLGKSQLDAKGFQEIREMVAALDKRAADLYRAAVKALNETYRFTFDYAYQTSVTKTALLDVAFDFAADKVKMEQLSALLQAAIAGDFRGVLPPPGEKAAAGVSFREAVLTHHLQRTSSVKITLPFFDSATVKQTSSLAKFRIEAEDGGVYLYELEAQDDVRRKGKWRSTLSVGLSLQAGAGVRRHGPERAQGSVDYRFMRRLPGLRTEQFQRLLDALAATYFPHALGGPEAPEKPTAHEWALALDKLTDGGEEDRDDGLIGDSWLRLEASLPGEAVARWLQAPADPGDLLYMDVSRLVQQLLRRFIPFLYFQDARRYEDLGSAYPLLVYAALPVTTSIRVEGGRVLELDTNRRVYWDWVSGSESGERRALLFDGRTALLLAAELAKAASVLESAGDPGLRKLSRRYAPDALESVRKSALESPGRILLESLIANETDVIDGAVKAGVKLAEFREKSADPEKAVAALAEFGDKITRTFHQKLQSVFKPKDAADRELLRNLGLLVFGEVSETLPPSAPIRAAARLELTVFRPGLMPAELGEAPEGAVLARQALAEPGFAG